MTTNIMTVMTSTPSPLSDPSIQSDIEPSSSQPNAVRTVEQQLTDSREAHQQRRQEMASGRSPTSSLHRVLRTIRTDHNTVRLAVVCVALMCSMFGAIVLVIAGDPPYRQGALYQYDDLMHLVSQIHAKSFEVTPNLSEKEWNQQMANQSSNESPLRQVLRQWWPIRSINFESNDTVVNDRNFYSRNYRTFQTAFVVLMVLGDGMLLFSWLYFLVWKELSKGPTNQNQTNNPAKGSQSPKTVSENTSELLERAKRFAKGKQLKQLKRSWLDEPPKRPWQRTSVVMIVSLVAMQCLLFCVLTTRPNLFALVLHQVDFVCLTVICLASTQMQPSAQPEMFNKAKQSPTASIQAPRSLRRSSRNRIHFQSPSLNGVAKSSDSNSSLINSNSKSIFMTEQSNKVRSSPSMDLYPTTNNPFDEDELKENKKFNNAFIDEEDEKLVENV